MLVSAPMDERHHPLKVLDEAVLVTPLTLLANTFTTS